MVGWNFPRERAADGGGADGGRRWGRPQSTFLNPPNSIFGRSLVVPPKDAAPRSHSFAPSSLIPHTPGSNPNPPPRHPFLALSAPLRPRRPPRFPFFRVWPSAFISVHPVSPSSLVSSRFRRQEWFQRRAQARPPSALSDSSMLNSPNQKKETWIKRIEKDKRRGRQSLLPMLPSALSDLSMLDSRLGKKNMDKADQVGWGRDLLLPGAFPPI